jgi:Protein of unknown function DUF2834
MSTNAKKILLAVVLADFLCLTGYAVYVHGIVGLFQLVTANLATLTAFVDLCIALSLISVWMWNDARARGLSPLPYVVLTLTLGSVGPLLYLLRREMSERVREPALAQQVARG